MKLAYSRPWITGLGMALLVLGYALTTTGVQQALRYGRLGSGSVSFGGGLLGGGRWRPGDAELIGWVVAALGAGLVGFAVSKRRSAGT